MDYAEFAYYYVKLEKGGKWAIAQHIAGDWFLTNDDTAYEDDDFDVIGDKVPMPPA
jgi:hypothetical protein